MPEDSDWNKLAVVPPAIQNNFWHQRIPLQSRMTLGEWIMRKPGKATSDFRIVRSAKSSQAPDNPRLFINGNAVVAAPKQIHLLACLYDNFGRVVPYDTLCKGIGLDTENKRHVLVQYVMLVRRLLEDKKAPCVLAVAIDIGYALCPIVR